MSNVFYPQKKVSEFGKELTFAIEGKVYKMPPCEVPCELEWQGTLHTSNPATHIDIDYGPIKLKRVIVEDWSGEGLQGRDFNLSVEIDAEFVVRPVLSLPVNDDGTGEPGELHFLLERCKLPVEGLVIPPTGGGLFERWMADPGRVNPATVRYSVQCEICDESFTFRSYHTGFLEVEYFYCDKSSQPLIISVNDSMLAFKRPGAGSQPDELTPAEIAYARKRIEALEEKLPKSDYDGTFRWLAPFRCPYCSTPFIDFRNNLFRKAWEYYVCCHKGHQLKQFSAEMIRKEKKGESSEKETPPQS